MSANDSSGQHDLPHDGKSGPSTPRDDSGGVPAALAGGQLSDPSEPSGTATVRAPVETAGLIGKKVSHSYYIAYENLQDAYTSLNRLDEAEEVLKQAEQRHVAGHWVAFRRYELAFLKGNDVQMGQLAAVIKEEPGMEDTLLATMADTEAWQGKIKNSRKLAGQASATVQQQSMSHSGR